MLFLTLSNADVQFEEKKLEQRSYKTAEALPTTKRVELINKRGFAAVALDENVETFVVHIAILSTAPTMQVYPLYQAQISLLLADKAPIKVPPKYSDYVDIFLFNLAIKLPKNTDMNKYTIELVKGKQLPYEQIQSLELGKLEILKIYIKTYLKTRFIQPYKFLANTLILFD